jgi:hypothetical protein
MQLAARRPHPAWDNLESGLLIGTSYYSLVSRVSSLVTILSGYGLDDRAIQVRSPAEAKGFLLLAFVLRPALGPTTHCTMGTRGPLPGLKRCWGVELTTHPHLVPRSRMSRSYTSAPPSSSMACSGAALALLQAYLLLCFKWFEKDASLLVCCLKFGCKEIKCVDTSCWRSRFKIFN